MRGKFDGQIFFDSIPTEDNPIWPVIVVDFNGVCDQYGVWHGEVEFYPPAEGVAEFLQDLRTLGFNTIVVCTATMPVELVEEWFVEHHLDVLVDYVTNHKPPASVYVDDRAVTHKGDFKETLRAVVGFKPHWMA